MDGEGATQQGGQPVGEDHGGFKRVDGYTASK
jgi:hypothetical protein